MIFTLAAIDTFGHALVLNVQILGTIFSTIMANRNDRMKLRLSLPHLVTQSVSQKS